ncbi:Zinc finger protein 226 [Nymphon striatum]|nr:Zinc finger protein 226 [Nymphon striatum]
MEKSSILYSNVCSLNLSHHLTKSCSIALIDLIHSKDEEIQAKLKNYQSEKARLVLKRLRLQQLRRKKLREINAKATTTRRDCNSRLHPVLNEICDSRNAVRFILDMEKLPQGFTYVFLGPTENQLFPTIRLDIRDAESAERWRRQLEENTKVTWRLNAGKAAVQDPLPELPGLVEFKYCHNHELISANSLKERDVSDEAKQKLQELFQNDHSPSSALEAFKIDLEFSEGENYDIDAADGAHLPDAGYCYSESLNTVKIKYEPVQSMNESDEEVDGTSHVRRKLSVSLPYAQKATVFSSVLSFLNTKMNASSKYRQRMKENNPERYEEYLRKQRERAKQQRDELRNELKKRGLSEEAKRKQERAKENNRERQRRYIEKLKEKAEDNAAKEKKRTKPKLTVRLKSFDAAPGPSKSTRADNENQREKWRTAKKKYRSTVSRQKKQIIKEKDRDRKKQKKLDAKQKKSGQTPDSLTCESINTVKIKYEPVQSMNENDEELDGTSYVEENWLSYEVKEVIEPVQSMNENDEEVDGTSYVEENWLSYEVKEEVKDEPTKPFQPDDKCGNMEITGGLAVPLYGLVQVDNGRLMWMRYTHISSDSYISDLSDEENPNSEEEVDNEIADVAFDLTKIHGSVGNCMSRAKLFRTPLTEGPEKIFDNQEKSIHLEINLSTPVISSSFTSPNLNTTQTLHDTEIQLEKSSTKNTFKCNVCQKCCSRKCHHSTHKKTHQKDECLKCKFCSKEFHYESRYARHLVIHSSKRPYKCEICSKGFKLEKNLREHNAVHSDNKPYTCDLCSTSFKRKSDLKKHHIIHSVGKLHACEICSKAFPRERDLKVHLLVHSDDKPYTCQICSMSFKRKCELKGHNVVHSKERPFKCDICSKDFKIKRHLERHKLIHSGEKPYTCGVCDKDFLQEAHLKSHLLVHSDVKPYKCEICSMKFKNSYHLRNHKKSHSDKKEFKCSICFKEIKYKQGLRRHLKLHSDS